MKGGRRLIENSGVLWSRRLSGKLYCTHDKKSLNNTVNTRVTGYKRMNSGPSWLVMQNVRATTVREGVAGAWT